MWKVARYSNFGDEPKEYWEYEEHRGYEESGPVFEAPLSNLTPSSTNW
jgi:hypothetical protein